MALGRKFCNHFSLLLLVISVITVSARVKQSETTKRKYKTSKSKPKIDKLNHWPFLPKPGNHYASTKGFPSYPFMILSPPGKEKESDVQLHDENGSKYFVNRRQFVPTMPYQQQNIVGYIPVYYTPQYYNFYTFGNTFSQQYLTGGGQSFVYSDYPLLQNPFLSKRSTAKKPHLVSGDKNAPIRKQFVPRHHWSFSQWPFDSHEYAFTKDPIYSSNHPHLPRWGPIEWGGAGPGPHWARNREGLPSPFGIGLAPHMGGQGYIGLAGHWPAGHGYPLPTHFPTPPHLQHLLP